jgi:beta-propeller uncharacterized protein DUF5122
MLQGIRVFELHQEHGLHVHLVTTSFIDVNRARLLAEKAGWGRIHVKRIPSERVTYLTKYLTKERPECLKRWRVWVVVIQPDGKILLGGDFTTLSPNGGVAVTHNRITWLNPDGTLDTAFNPNANGIVDSIAVQGDGKILAGGFAGHELT